MYIFIPVYTFYFIVFRNFYPKLAFYLLNNNLFWFFYPDPSITCSLPKPVPVTLKVTGTCFPNIPTPS